MEWLLELMERPLNKNFKTSFQFVKVAILVSFASVLYETGNGKYYIVDLSNIKLRLVRASRSVLLLWKRPLPKKIAQLG